MVSHVCQTKIRRDVPTPLPMMSSNSGGMKVHKQKMPGEIELDLTHIGAWASEYDFGPQTTVENPDYPGQQPESAFPLGCDRRFTLDEIRAAYSTRPGASSLERFLEEQNPSNMPVQERLLHIKL